MSRIAVTGAAGFVGAALVERLAGDHDLVAVVRSRASASRLSRLAGEIEIVEADFEHPEQAAALVAAAKPEICVHAAAAGAVVRDPDPQRTFRVNAQAPFELALALADTGCRQLVSLGSSSEYGPCTQPMREDQAPTPDDVYGATKLAGGAAARAVSADRGLAFTHLRLFSVYGPGEDLRRMVASTAVALVHGEPLDLTPGEQARDFVFIDDVVDAIVATFGRCDIDGETFNIGSGIQSTVREMALALAEAADADQTLLRFGARPYRDNERFSWQADPVKAAQLLGWRASTSLRDGAAATVAALTSSL